MNTTLMKRFGWLRLGALALFCGWTHWVGAASITVDHPDYYPGDTVTITGADFGANDDVAVQVLHVREIFDNNSSAAHVPWHVTASAGGGFVTTWVVPIDEDEEGVTLQATATGSPSGQSAIVIFTDAAALPGLAPVSPPTGGFRIEGDLQANTPTVGQGDWVPGPTGSGQNVLTAAGVPVNSITTFHLIDLYSSGSDDNFAGGDKVHDNPSTWAWTRNPVGDKVDINNALFHITSDSFGHQWAVFSGDRLSENGDAYIDFEFLQNTMTITTNGAGTGGGFVTAGPNGGRTVGDFLLTVALTKGGNTAGFFIEQWKAKTGGGFDYFDVDISTLPANTVFAAVNTSAGTPVPYGAFGTTTYQKNTFAEAAIDLTALIDSAFDPCTGLQIKTIFVKTKESQSPTANIVDLITPIQVSLTIGPADAGQDQTTCADPSGTTTFSVTGTAHPGLNSIASMTWSVVGGTATVSPTTCSSCTSLPATVNVTASPATLRLTVVDTAGCSKSDDVVLTAKPLPSCDISGDASVYPGSVGNPYTGPAGMESYAWTVSSNPGVHVQPGTATVQTLLLDIDSGASGSFTLTLTTTLNGCAKTCEKLVEISPPEEGCNVSGPLTVCAGATLIHYSATPAGGASYAWSLVNSGGATASISSTSGRDAYVSAGSTAGSFTIQVVVTLNSGASITCALPVTVGLVSASSTATPILCSGGDSTVTVSATGGTPAYSGTGTFTRKAGTYTFPVTDANGCPASTTITISEPTAVVASSSATPILCSGGDSTVTVSATGGTPAYSGTGTFTRKAGTYTFPVTDANGCPASTTITISEPTAVVASSSATPILCSGGDSTVTVSATGGTPAYSGTGTFTRKAGTYTFPVTDANGCPASTTITINEPTAVVASSSATPILCSGGDSTVTVSATGGTPAYSGTGTFTRKAGTYTFPVTDANGCPASTTITINEPTAVVASSSATPILCSGGDSTVTVSATGGTPAYSGTGTFTRKAGTYTFPVTDANGCPASTTITINEPTAVVASSSATPILCSGGDSTVTVSATGGTPAYSGTGTFTRKAGTYTFPVTDANGCPASTTITINEPTAVVASSSATPILCSGGDSTVTVSATGGTPAYSGTGTFTRKAGTYTFPVTDANGCPASTTITINEPTAVVASSSATPILCNGGDSTVTVSATGGTPAYSGTGTFTRKAGTYTFPVTDANGCPASTTITINEPTAVVASSSATPILCSGGDSTVTVSATGGTPAYSGTGTFTRKAGTYTFPVTDANGCPASTTITINEPTAVVASSSATPILCSGGDSTVTVSATGGTPAYSGTGTFTRKAGTYTFPVTDANGCPASTTITINEPTAVVASSSATPILCNGGDSTVTVTASGGSGPYTGTGSFTVKAGPYSYTVTDHNGCTAVATGTITEPPLLSCSLTSTDVKCNGAANGTITASASGGTAPIQCKLDSGSFGTLQTFSGVAPGPHTVSFKDAKGCTDAKTVTINQPEALACAVSGSSMVPSGSSGNTLTANVTGGTQPYAYSWTVDNAAWVIASKTANPVSFSAPNAASSATFTVVVTDTNGCTTTCTEQVTSTPPSLVTDTMRCTLLPTSCSAANSLRLLFTQDPQNMPCYRLTASNPGQFYYNVFYTGPVGSTVDFYISLPYPFVTQGANPVEFYDGVTVNASGGQTCLVPGNKFAAGSSQVTLASYTDSNHDGKLLGEMTVVHVTAVVPSSGHVFVAIHLDYGLKGTTGYTQDSNHNALDCTSLAMRIPVTQSYTFSVDGSTTDSATATSCNAFKKNSGAGGLAINSLTTYEVPGANAVLKDAKGSVLATGTTDEDGWYLLNYKYTGKAANFTVTLTPPGGKAKTQAITLKANGYVEVNFTVP